MATTSIVVTGHERNGRGREVLERALYGGWQIAEYEAASDGRDTFTAVVVPEAGAEDYCAERVQYQAGRLESFMWWVSVLPF